MRASTQGKKRKFIKIGSKLSYIIGPGNQMAKTPGSFNFNSKLLKTATDKQSGKFDLGLYKDDLLNPLNEIDPDTGRKSDATTLKEAGHSVNGKKEGKKDKTSKRKKSKKKSENYYMVHSPPHSHFNGYTSNLLHLIPELSKHKLKKLKGSGSNRNLSKDFEVLKEESSKSLKEIDLEMPNNHKMSMSSATEDFIPQKASMNSELKSKYESEISKLKDTIAKAKENEKTLVRRIQKLEEEQALSDKKFKEMEHLVKQLLVQKPSHSQNFELKRDSIESNFSKSDQNKDDGVLKCIQPLVNEILAFREKVDTQAKEIDYLRQKENKLMYLFFILHKRGVDVNDVYESELRDVPTDRFNEWIKEHMDDEEPPDISFDSQASYSPILEGPMPQPKRPEKVPQLNLVTIPDYITSSDEEEENNESSIFAMKNKSVDGSKLHRPSDLHSECSLSFTQQKDKENDEMKHYKEEFSITDEIKINRHKVRDKNKMQTDSSLDNIVRVMPAVSQSLNTDNIHFNM